MVSIKLWFSDFSSDFVPEADFFYRLISRRFKIILDRERPDFLIYSCYGSEYLRYDCVRIFYTAENIRPDFNLCDYAIGFDRMSFGDRYFRFPNYARYEAQFEALIRLKPFSEATLETKSKFCNFIYSNAFADPARDAFFQKLSACRRVDSLGRHLNNQAGHGGDRDAPGWRQSKVEMMQPYRFSIAFENSSAPGYTTEKLMHAFIGETIPVYWGDPDVALDFNPKAFVNCHEFADWDAVVARIIELDQNPAAYLAMLNEPPFPGNRIPVELSDGRLLEFFASIFSRSSSQAFRRSRFGSTLSYENTARRAAALLQKDARISPIRRILGAIRRRLGR